MIGSSLGFSLIGLSLGSSVIGFSSGSAIIDSLGHQCFFCRYQVNCPLESCAPENCPPENSPQWNYPPYEYLPLWQLPHRKITPQNFSPEKIATCENSPPPWENYPQWNSLPTYKSYKWKKNKIAKIFALKKAAQDNILIKIPTVLFRTQMISQKILG